jgi:hypothetical protein
MTLSELQPDVAFLRAREERFLADYTDDQLRSLHIDTAKKVLRLHLGEALNIDLKDQEQLRYLDELVDWHEERLQYSLTILQLTYIFGAHQYGPGVTLNQEKMEKWEREYAKLRRGFSGLTRPRGTSEVLVFTTGK